MLSDQQELPTASVSIEAQVLSGESVEPGLKRLPCFGFFEGFQNTDAATMFSLMDDAGTAWTLWFPTGLVPATHFAPGATLQIDYRRASFSILAVEHRLLVREGGEVALFVDHGSRTPVEIAGLDLTQSLGELACPWTGGACSEARSHTLVESAGESVTDPCGATVGGFSFSSLSHDGRGISCGQGVCDKTSRYFAAGVRIQ